MVTAFVFISAVPERQEELVDVIGARAEVVECHRFVGGELMARLSCADLAGVHQFVADQLRNEGVEIRIERVEATVKQASGAAALDSVTAKRGASIPPPPPSASPNSAPASQGRSGGRPRPRPLSNRERDVIRALAAVVWVDGNADPAELEIVDQVISGYAVSPEQRKELAEFVRSERGLDTTMSLDQLGAEDRELLLTNAAIITHADGVQLPSEKTMLTRLGKMLGYSEEQATVIVQSAVEEGAISLSSRALEDEAD
ncbi:TerB family tellurite resistance protein [Pendulispora rubella]|uniref:TerB family tellurite resistance protein n=1 Tax=Pendulispora rubella TaxID=2741070 RepID=A0ABZ2LI32_9BACT